MPGPKRKTIEDRFWPKVAMSMTCWLWTGSKMPRGYGRIGGGGKRGNPLLAHRVSWEIHFGKIPARLIVCHRCDNPSCVNPTHLFVGTHEDNTQDAVRKGRISRGSSRHNARLSEKDIPEVRRRLAIGESYSSVAALFGVSAALIGDVARGVTWKHVP